MVAGVIADVSGVAGATGAAEPAATGVAGATGAAEPAAGVAGAAAEPDAGIAAADEPDAGIAGAEEPDAGIAGADEPDAGIAGADGVTGGIAGSPIPAFASCALMVAEKPPAEPFAVPDSATFAPPLPPPLVDSHAASAAIPTATMAIRQLTPIRDTRNHSPTLVAVCDAEKTTSDESLNSSL